MVLRCARASRARELRYKCVQLVQGEIMLISITIILLFNFEKNISYVFLFLRNFKISFPSVFPVYLVLF